MARTSRSKATSTGPGRGSPRTRTAARPGERAATQRGRARPVDLAEEQTPPRPPQPGRRRFGALGVTWRLIAVGVVVAVVAMTLAQSLRVYFAQAQELASLRVEIQSKHDEIAHLGDELERWKDPQFIKAQARDRLGWVMPGDTGYRVIGVDGEPIGGDNAVLHPEATPTGPWHERMWGSVAVADQPSEEATETPVPSPPPATILPSPTASESE